jgi:hypothetical protein
VTVPTTAPAPPQTVADTVPANPGSFDAGGSTPAYTGTNGNTGTAATAPGTPVRPAATASSPRPQAPVTNPVSSGLRNFLGGDHQLFLPVLFVVGAVALIAGPLMTLRSQGKLRRRRSVAGAGAR